MIRRPAGRLDSIPERAGQNGPVGKQVISDSRRRPPEMLRLTSEKYTANPVGMG